MVQLEGPIVQSIYDSAILSWWMSFKDPLPLLARPPEYADALSQSDFVFGASNQDVTAMGDIEAIAERTRQRLVLIPSPPSPTENGATPPPPPFNPVVVHAPHAPVPIAMVNRTPRGRRGCGDAFVPQNQAWLAGFKFASRRVFLQTPTFSAKPIVLAALDAVRRGVIVEIYADLEFDGGTPSADGRANQLVAAYMYSQLAPEHRPNLRVYWYTAKGDVSPLSTRGSAHTCHIKLMSACAPEVADRSRGRADRRAG
jgi:phosphatidylserine/phosphatidylglycerophosphate/cardiolipin synthase-like enzyme